MKKDDGARSAGTSPEVPSVQVRRETEISTADVVCDCRWPCSHGPVPAISVSPALIVGDVFAAELPQRHFALVYADPPYAGCRARYARGNNSRQWGRDARADFMRDLIARMEQLRAEDGVCAVSMGTPELRLLNLFPSKCRVAAWVKPNVSPRPGIWPSFAWEPLVMWGALPTDKGAPNDWREISPRVKNRRGHETPKPDAFAEWVLELTLGNRRGSVCELFAGTAPVSRLAVERGMYAVAVDLTDYLTGAA